MRRLNICKFASIRENGALILCFKNKKNDFENLFKELALCPGVPRCMSYHGAIGGLVITGRAHCLSFWLHIYIYIYIYICMYIFYSFLFYIYLYIYIERESLILAPISIQLVYAVHKHAQFKMIWKQSYGNDCSS